MATQQPEWRLLANLGDVNPIDYGGYFVYEDATGVYPPEAELLEAPEDDDGTWTAYRVVLEPCTFIDGVLSDNQFHPDFPVWFADKLASVAASMSYDLDELRADLCGSDPIRRATAYRAIYDHHGWENGDSYPLTLTRDEAEKRYAVPA